jgi:hypothetical protein
MPKPSQSEAQIKIGDGRLSVSMALSSAEEKHLKNQQETEGELALRAAALYFLKRAMLRDAAELSKKVDDARMAKITAARGGRQAVRVDVPVARGSGKGMRVG